jgi:hypothetical protein
MTQSTNDELTGVWHSRYWYPSNDHDGEDVSEYEMDAHLKGNRLTMTSLPSKDGSYMSLKLTIDDGLATGAWQESTAPLGEFKGMVYSGAMQLIISDDNKHMDGKWVGVGREKLDDGSYEAQIYTGRWTLERAPRA